MNPFIDEKSVGQVEGFDISARLKPDYESSPDDSDCYDSEAIVAYRRNEWAYVTTEVIASKAGVELGHAYLGGSEYGWFPVDGESQFETPLDGEGDDFINGYGPDLIAEAIADAKATIKEITA
ncbi:hypothetical protein PBI_ACHEBE_79 [Mycobacterium phage Achebe]|nr:hypothetical protein PBI_ACHEBE_79 [Mycobacterium phage Achebe]